MMRTSPPLSGLKRDQLIDCNDGGMLGVRPCCARS
jgi:hypothetical protein